MALIQKRTPLLLYNVSIVILIKPVLPFLIHKNTCKHGPSAISNDPANGIDPRVAVYRKVAR